MKTYIGEGKRNEKIPGIIDVVIDMNKIQKDWLFEGEKGTYLRFSVGERKETDKFGNTHTVSFWQPDARPANVPEPAMANEPAPEASTEKKRRKNRQA